MKKRFLTASLATMMVLSLAACGGGKAADTTTAPAATEAPADTGAADAGTVEAGAEDAGTVEAGAEDAGTAADTGPVEEMQNTSE